LELLPNRISTIVKLLYLRFDLRILIFILFQVSQLSSGCLQLLHRVSELLQQRVKIVFGVLDEALELQLDELVCLVEQRILDPRAVKDDEELRLLRLLVLDVVHHFGEQFDRVFVLEEIVLVGDLQARGLVTSETERGHLSVLF
jgi:hypothetical protein